jgi:hypothetical protein
VKERELDRPISPVFRCVTGAPLSSVSPLCATRRKAAALVTSLHLHQPSCVWRSDRHARMMGRRFSGLVELHPKSTPHRPRLLETPDDFARATRARSMGSSSEIVCKFPPRDMSGHWRRIEPRPRHRRIERVMRRRSIADLWNRREPPDRNRRSERQDQQASHSGLSTTRSPICLRASR